MTLEHQPFIGAKKEPSPFSSEEAALIKSIFYFAQMKELATHVFAKSSALNGTN